jgi:hypothetical protein
VTAKNPYTATEPQRPQGTSQGIPGHCRLLLYRPQVRARNPPCRTRKVPLSCVMTEHTAPPPCPCMAPPSSDARTRPQPAQVANVRQVHARSAAGIWNLASGIRQPPTASLPMRTAHHG